ncbi:hypothetical protein QF030_001831 [Streptomyces rishiriensis]|uniref:Uncharacterized protein n=1 Tax=Streptomyces rishiriensis TaxID=68264 RepID=A0ABU0NLQ5_STRRH|nr:hypothetical protein [Streptomyces rishiriensis]
MTAPTHFEPTDSSSSSSSSGASGCTSTETPAAGPRLRRRPRLLKTLAGCFHPASRPRTSSARCSSTGTSRLRAAGTSSHTDSQSALQQAGARGWASGARARRRRRGSSGPGAAAPARTPRTRPGPPRPAAGQSGRPPPRATRACGEHRPYASVPPPAPAGRLRPQRVPGRRRHPVRRDLRQPQPPQPVRPISSTRSSARANAVLVVLVGGRRSRSSSQNREPSGGLDRFTGPCAFVAADGLAGGPGTGGQGGRAGAGAGRRPQLTMRCSRRGGAARVDAGSGQPVWTRGRRSRSGSASRRTSRVTGATSPWPKRKKRRKLAKGLPSVHSK